MFSCVTSSLDDHAALHQSFLLSLYLSPSSICHSVLTLWPPAPNVVQKLWTQQELPRKILSTATVFLTHLKLIQLTEAGQEQERECIWGYNFQGRLQHHDELILWAGVVMWGPKPPQGTYNCYMLFYIYVEKAQFPCLQPLQSSWAPTTKLFLLQLELALQCGRTFYTGGRLLG